MCDMDCAQNKYILESQTVLLFFLKIINMNSFVSESK